MESSEKVTDSSVGKSDDQSNESATTVSVPDTSSPVAVQEESSKGCRKSSRLKAKMTRKSEGAEKGEEEAGDAYNLRLSSLVKRVQVERRQSTPKQPKGKSKPPPLSKYRRRTANARERMRMQDMNDGFEHLRECLPEMEGQPENEVKKKEKVTKLTVLNLALNYIHALRDILGYPAISDSSGSSEGVSAHSKGSDLSSDAASTRTLSTSSPSCDEVCSNLSPDSSSVVDVKDMKEFSLSDMPSYITSEISKNLPHCQDSASSSMMEFRMEARCSPSSSDLSLSPTPSALPLPEDCMDIDPLDVSLSLAEWEDIGDIIL
ncbi:hypothetical protein ACOMHN_034346 [Nucella lapillus]